MDGTVVGAAQVQAQGAGAGAASTSHVSAAARPYGNITGTSFFAVVEGGGGPEA